MELLNLPVELLRLILTFLQEKSTEAELFSLCRTCTTFNVIIHSLPAKVIKCRYQRVLCVRNNCLASLRKTDIIIEKPCIELQLELLIGQRSHVFNYFAQHTNLDSYLLQLYASIIGRGKFLQQVNLPPVVLPDSTYQWDAELIARVIDILPLSYVLLDNSAHDETTCNFPELTRDIKYYYVLSSELSTLLSNSNGLTRDIIFTIGLLRGFYIVDKNNKKCGIELTFWNAYGWNIDQNRQMRKFRIRFFGDLCELLTLHGLYINAPVIYFIKIFNYEHQIMSIYTKGSLIELLLNRDKLELLMSIRQLHGLIGLSFRELHLIISIYCGYICLFYAGPMTVERKRKWWSVMETNIPLYNDISMKNKAKLIYIAYCKNDNILLKSLLKWLNCPNLFSTALSPILSNNETDDAEKFKYHVLITFIFYRKLNIITFITPNVLREINDGDEISHNLELLFELCPKLQMVFPTLVDAVQNGQLSVVSQWLLKLAPYAADSSNNDIIGIMWIAILKWSVYLPSKLRINLLHNAYQILDLDTYKTPHLVKSTTKMLQYMTNEIKIFLQKLPMLSMNGSEG